MIFQGTRIRFSDVERERLREPVIAQRMMRRIASKRAAATTLSEAAEALVQAGRFKEAIGALDRCLRKLPLTCPMLIAKYGRCLHYMGDHERAEDDFRLADEEVRKKPDELFFVGYELAEAGQYRRALRILDLAWKYDATARQKPLADFYTPRGWCHFGVRKFRAAHSDFSKALLHGESTDFGILYVLAAAVHLGRKESDSALLVLREKVAPKLRGQRWPFPLLQLFNDGITEREFLAQLNDKNKRIARQRQCEGYFYLGVWKHLHNRREAAESCYRKCLRTRVIDFREYRAAAIELGNGSAEKQRHGKVTK